MRRLVLDVWHGNADVDFPEWVRRHGLWAAIVKCGGHEYLRDSDGTFQSTKTYYEDSQFRALTSRAGDSHLHVGTYYYGSATTVGEALAEADHCLDLITSVDLDMPVYYDVEEREQLGLPMWQLTAVVRAFCNRVEKAGYLAGIYSGYDGFSNMLSSDISGYALWVASWRATWPLWAKDCGMWQQGSMRLSDGDIQYDDVRGYVDVSWCQVDYPTLTREGESMRKIDPAEVAALIHMDMVTDPRNGYSQSPRWGGDHPDGVKRLDINGHSYEYPLGSYDCSSSVTTAWRQALRYTEYEGCLGTNAGERTSTMRGTFCGTGLFRASYTAACRGDLYLNEGVHVAMCQDGGDDGAYGYDCLSEFNRNENHAATGGQVGDQDGGEAVMRAYYDDGWNTILHYVGGLLRDVTDEGEGTDMEATMFFVRLDGDPTEHFFDGQHLHAIANPDEKTAIVQFYRLAGVEVPVKAKEFGTSEEPWGARLNDALSRGANFGGFERFSKHPSARAVTREEATKAADRVINFIDAKDGE